MSDETLPAPPPGYDPISEEPPSPMLSAINVAVVEWREGFARIEGPIAPPVINRSGVVHGGALMTMLDAAAGYAGCWCPYPGRVRRALTLSLTTNFVAAPAGARFIAEGRVTGGGATVFFAEATVSDERDTVLATATGVFKVPRASRSLYGERRAT